MPLPQFGRYGAVGFEFAASVGAGFFIGRALDSHFQTHGVAMWIGFFLGVLSGFMLLVRTARQLETDAAKEEQDTPPLNEAPTQGDRLQKKLEDVEAKIAEDEAGENEKR
jgi:hypothetical protein